MGVACDNALDLLDKDTNISEQPKTPFHFEPGHVLAIDVPQECTPGILLNLSMHAMHARILEAYLTDEAESAAKVPPDEVRLERGDTNGSGSKSEAGS
jgi:hypothetical protein